MTTDSKQAEVAKTQADNAANQVEARKAYADAAHANQAAQPRRLSDVRGGVSQTVPIDGFLDTEITVLDFKEMDSAFGDKDTYLIITAVTADGEQVHIRCSGVNVRRRLIEFKDELPLVVTPRKRGRMFDIE